MLEVENLHILHQSNEILHIFVELFIYMSYHKETEGHFEVGLATLTLPPQNIIALLPHRLDALYMLIFI